MKKWILKLASKAKAAVSNVRGGKVITCPFLLQGDSEGVVTPAALEHFEKLCASGGTLKDLEDKLWLYNNAICRTSLEQGLWVTMHAHTHIHEGLPKVQGKCVKWYKNFKNFYTKISFLNSILKCPPISTPHTVSDKILWTI